MNNKLKIWVVYNRPLDFPDKYVARLFINDKPTQKIIVEDDLEKIRNEMQLNELTKIPRHESDPPSVVESWF